MTPRGWKAWSEEGRLACELELVDELIAPLEADAPLPAALAFSAREHPRRVLRSALGAIAADTGSGSRLAGALLRAAPVASPGLIAAVRAGERAGDVLASLLAYEKHLEARLAQARGSADAWLQPLLVLACALGVVLLLLVAGTVGGFVDLTSGGLGHRVLAVMTAHSFVSAAAVFAATVAVALGQRMFFRTPRGERLLHRLPLVGSLRRERDLALAWRTSAVLARAGVTLPESLALASDVLRDGSPERLALQLASSRLRAGEPPLAAFSSPTHLLEAALLSMPGDGADLERRLSMAARWHEAESARLSEQVRVAATVLAVTTAALGAGTVTILAWTGYFSISRFMAN